MTLGLFVCYIVDINVIVGGTIMQFNCKTNDIVYKIFRNEETVYIKEFVVIECENRNLICQDEDGNYYKFNYFEDNLIIDKSVVDELFSNTVIPPSLIVVLPEIAPPFAAAVLL